jgi:hypothetical protein
MPPFSVYLPFWPCVRPLQAHGTMANPAAVLILVAAADALLPYMTSAATLWAPRGGQFTGIGHGQKLPSCLPVLLACSTPDGRLGCLPQLAAAT